MLDLAASLNVWVALSSMFLLTTLKILGVYYALLAIRFAIKTKISKVTTILIFLNSAKGLSDLKL
jgi:hypothetical protein